jgi:hypothetical protein
MRTTCLLLVSIFFCLFIKAQSPVGKWKFLSYTMESRDGVKTDLLKDFVKEHACFKTALISFTQDGRMNALDDACPADIRQAGLGAKWKTAGKNKLLIFADDTDIDPVIYQFEITGNKMRWTIRYDADESSDVKQLIAEFIKA